MGKEQRKTGFRNKHKILRGVCACVHGRARTSVYVCMSAYVCVRMSVYLHSCVYTRGCVRDERDNSASVYTALSLLPTLLSPPGVVRTPVSE